MLRRLTSHAGCAIPATLGVVHLLSGLAAAPYIVAACGELLRVGGVPALWRGVLTLLAFLAAALGAAASLGSYAVRRDLSSWPLFTLGGVALCVGGVLWARACLGVVHATIAIPAPHGTVGVLLISLSVASLAALVVFFAYLITHIRW